MVVRVDGRVTLGAYMWPDCMCPRVVQGWCKGGARVVQGWWKDGARVVQGWCKGGARVVQGWCKDGARMVQGWCKDGARMVQGWCKGGARMVQGLDRGKKKDAQGDKFLGKGTQSTLISRDLGIRAMVTKNSGEYCFCYHTSSVGTLVDCAMAKTVIDKRSLGHGT
jgi:hypothetical protein